MPLYRISGLTVAATMPLPGVASTEAGAHEVDVRIACAPTPERLERATSRQALWEVDERRFLWRLPEIGRFLATGGVSLDVEPASDATVRDVLPFLLGTGMGAVLYQRGRLPLHASAVSIEGRAIILCGHTGVGKSTLAAALCAAGCALLCDDVAALDVDAAGRVVVWPDGRSLKLLDASIARLNLHDAREEEVRAGTGKHYVTPRHRPPEGAARVHAVYVLNDGAPADAPNVTPTSALEAAQVLLNYSYRQRLGLASARTRSPVPHTAALLRQARVARFTRPRELARLEESVAALLADARA
jgi:hypothetical protein